MSRAAAVFLVIFLLCSPPGSRAAAHLAVSGTAGGEATGRRFPVAVMDSAGRTVRFAGPPRRIVVGPGSTSYWTEILHCLRLDDRVVGVGFSERRNEYLSAAVRQKPAICSMSGMIDWERVVALHADLLIIGHWYGDLGAEDRATVRRADKLGIRVLALGIPDTSRTGTRMPDENIRIIRLLGRIFDRGERAEQLADFLERLLDRARRIAARTSPLGTRVLVVWGSSIIYDFGGGRVYVSASGTCAESVALVGAHNAAMDFHFGTPWPLLGMERIIAYFENSVDLVIVAGDAGWRNALPKAVEKVKGDALWQTLKAVRDGKVIGVPFDGPERGSPYVYGPRFIAAVYAMGHAIDPERYPDWKDVLEDLTLRFYEPE